MEYVKYDQPRICRIEKYEYTQPKYDLEKPKYASICTENTNSNPKNLYVKSACL